MWSAAPFEYKVTIPAGYKTLHGLYQGSAIFAWTPLGTLLLCRSGWITSPGIRGFFGLLVLTFRRS